MVPRKNSFMNTSSRLYVGADLMKLICALLIVFMHTYNHDWGVVGEWVHTTLTPIGVPFFFIVSGFFYAKGLQKTSEKKDYFSRYAKRIINMYIFWTVVTLPVAWMNLGIAHADYGTGLKLLYIVRCFFFTGSTAIYLAHFPTMLIFDYYLVRGTLLDFSFVIAVSFILYYLLSFVFPPRILKVIYG